MNSYCVQVTKFGNRMNERILFIVTTRWPFATVSFLPRGWQNIRLTVGEVLWWRWRAGRITGYHESGDVIWARSKDR